MDVDCENHLQAENPASVAAYNQQLSTVKTTPSTNFKQSQKTLRVKHTTTTMTHTTMHQQFQIERTQQFCRKNVSSGNSSVFKNEAKDAQLPKADPTEANPEGGIRIQKQISYASSYQQAEREGRALSQLHPQGEINPEVTCGGAQESLKDIRMEERTPQQQVTTHGTLVSISNGTN